jgi:hypothetical protein
MGQISYWHVIQCVRRERGDVLVRVSLFIILHSIVILGHCYKSKNSGLTLELSRHGQDTGDIYRRYKKYGMPRFIGCKNHVTNKKFQKGFPYNRSQQKTFKVSSLVKLQQRISRKECANYSYNHLC